ncbi:MAG: PLAT/LH2 domain-containing protein [Armatimonadota bacterium]
MRWVASVVVAAATVVWPLAAWGYDAAPHFDLTRDAMAAEGFGDTAIEIAQVTTWMCDYYEQAAANPYSGWSDGLRRFLAGAWGAQAAWPEAVARGAGKFHFDTNTVLTIDGRPTPLESGEAVSKEWDRLVNATTVVARERARAGDTLGLLVALGITLHEVQDFYAHTNWVEPLGPASTTGYDGPGFAQSGLYGSHPTWFDVPARVRREAPLMAGLVWPKRGHGYWNSDGNRNLATMVNKDWPGRPYYLQSYVAAYFATRQWIRVVRVWIGDESAWRAAQAFSNRYGDALDHEMDGAVSIQFNAGHWQGQGEPAGGDASGPGGSLDDLSGSLRRYHSREATVIRQKFEQMVPSLAALEVRATPVPREPESSARMQAETEFVIVKVERVADRTGATEVGIDPGADQADFYARASIAGQEFLSAMIHGYDTWTFQLPSAPFTFVKAVPRDWETEEPVTTLQVRVRTRDEQWAGTDDDVYLRINDTTRSLLDKPLYNDFERGDEDTYSLDPPRGLRRSDIRYLQIEKAPDGAAGGWKLSRVALIVNGEQIYYRDRIDTWLEDDHRAWRAPDFAPAGPRTREAPITVALYDSDGGLYGSDDRCDIHPDYNRYDLNLLYDRATGRYRGDLGGTRTGASEGGSNHGGRGSDSDRCEIAFAIETMRPTPAPPRPQLAPALRRPRVGPAR